MKSNNIIGTVMKVTDTHIVLLLDNGSFKNMNRSAIDKIPLLGQRLEYKQQQKTFLPWIKYATIACVLFVAIASMYMINISKAEPAYLLAVDINPSIEILLDSELEIIDVSGNNVEGQEILQKLHFSKSLAHFMDALIVQSIKEGYLESTEDIQSIIETTNDLFSDSYSINLEEYELAIIQTTFIPMSQNLPLPIEELTQSIETSILNHRVSAEFTLEIEEKDILEEAKELELTIHQYKMYHQLKEKQLVEKVEDIRGKSMKELHQKNSTMQKRNASQDNTKGKAPHANEKSKVQDEFDSNISTNDHKDLIHNREKREEVMDQKKGAPSEKANEKAKEVVSDKNSTRKPIHENKKPANQNSSNNSKPSQVQNKENNSNIADREGNNVPVKNDRNNNLPNNNPSHNNRDGKGNNNNRP